MNIFFIILGIYSLIMFINFLYMNRKDYKHFDNEKWLSIVFAIFFWPMFLLYNIVTYWIPFQKFKSSHKYTWWFKWWDLVEYEWRVWVVVYLWTSWIDIVYEWEYKVSSIYDMKNVFIQYRWEVSEELAMLD